MVKVQIEGKQQIGPRIKLNQDKLNHYKPGHCIFGFQSFAWRNICGK